MNGMEGGPKMIFDSFFNVVSPPSFFLFFKSAAIPRELHEDDSN